MGNQKIKIIISGGGTGGHVFPAIAIAHALRKLHERVELLFVGAKGKLEMHKIPQAGYEIKGLPIAGFQRKFSLKNLLLPVKIIQSLLITNKIFRNFKPDAAVGVGGYASAPVLFVAQTRGVPTAIQEQNSYAGITNRMLGKKADLICLAYENAKKFFREDKVKITGNPVRDRIRYSRVTKEEGLKIFNLDPAKKTILVVGGSLGARSINQAVDKNLKAINDLNLQVIWQTGKWYIDQAEHSAENHPHIRVHQFIENMEAAYAAADIIVSRAGAIAIAELCIVGKPVILVPSPNVAEDHQTKNALSLTEKNAALMIKDAELNARFVPELKNLLEDTAKQQHLSENIKKMAVPDAAERIAKEILKLLSK